MTNRSTLPFDEPPPSPSRPRRRVFTVAELTAAIRLTLESGFPEIWIEGEISNARVWKTGHLYFTLKDADAQLRAVMFRSSVRRLRFRPDNGQHVVARGRLSVYDPKGEYQIVCEHLEPHGLGALQLAFEQLRERLAHEGLFDDDRKRPLPALPRKIGIVTSLDGAAIRDILTVLNRRYPNAHVVISPARVQGDGAPGAIVRGLTQLGHVSNIDVIIVARGGGSIEDLWAFNEERVARAIVASPVPVVSAVGHETDFTISDFVADLRAPTPSAAAELVVGRKDEMVARIQRSEERLRTSLRAGLHQRRTSLHTLERRPGLAGWPTRLAGHGRRADELTHRLHDALTSTVARRDRSLSALRRRLETVDLGRWVSRIRTRLVAVDGQLTHVMREVRGRHVVTLGDVAARLEALSPLAVLARGYAVCWNADRSAIIRESTAVTPGESVSIRLHRGELECEVKDTK